MRTVLWMFAAAALATLGCGGGDDGGGDGDGNGGRSLDQSESLTLPPEYLLIPEEVSRTVGIDPARLPGKWLTGGGGNVDVLVSSGSTYDTYRTDSSGDSLLYNFHSDGTYHLIYLFDITTGYVHSSSSSVEIGTWALDAAGETLTLTPSANRASYCNSSGCQVQQEANDVRVYALYSVALKPFDINGNDNGQRNEGIVMAGPCAAYMFDLDGYMCETGKQIEAIYQSVL